MQTLGLADSTPRTENRLKSIFWPSIQSGADVNYLGAQGYWVCAVVAGMSLVFLSVTGHPISAVFTFLFYFVSGVGVREQSRYAAAMALTLFLLDILFSGINVVKVIFTAVLLSNLRATCIASRWRPESEQAELPPRLHETLGDKITDQLPVWLWPKVRIVYYIYSACWLGLVFLGFVMLRLGLAR